MATVPQGYPRPGPLGQTDPLRWRLSSGTDGGRHVWHYTRDTDALETSSYEQVWGDDKERVRDRKEPDDETAYWLGLQLPRLDNVDSEPAQTPYDAAKKGALSPPLAHLRIAARD